MKVGYRTASGGVSTVYLLDDGIKDSDEFAGIDKHTGEPVLVRWTGNTWVEVSS